MTSDKERPLTIGLKYCGGCKPNYDRVALVEQLRERLAGKAVVERHDHPAVGLILAVQGCPTACADLTPFNHLPVFIITRPEEVDRFVAYIKKHLTGRIAE